MSKVYFAKEIVSILNQIDFSQFGQIRFGAKSQAASLRK